MAHLDVKKLRWAVGSWLDDAELDPLADYGTAAAPVPAYRQDNLTIWKGGAFDPAADLPADWTFRADHWIE